MKKYIKIIFVALAVSVVVLLSGTVIYTSDYYRADDMAVSAQAGAQKLEDTQRDDVLIFSPEEARCGFIFYPGGKVEYTAYAPLMEQLSQNGILCVLVKMPMNLAVFDIDAADGIQENYPDIDKWYIGGHSLGGSMAAAYVYENSRDYTGLVMLAAYSTENLSRTELEVLSVYGSEDTVLNMEKYNKYASNLPQDSREVVIQGGCHAYFGNYGRQDGDGVPVITRQQQQEITVSEIINFMK